MIETKALTKKYNIGRTTEVLAITDANMTAKSGEITVLVGPSGCGKTTLMSMIGLLLTPTKGNVFYDGEDITGYSDGWKAVFRRDNIGFVFQHINLLPNLNAYENIIIPLLCHDTDPKDHEEEALNLLQRLGLSERAYFNVEQLSGGQQQRVAIARALITHPKIIIADEPLTFVDLESSKVITNFLDELRQEGKTILISTHSSELAKMADRTYVIKDGLIIDNILNERQKD